MSERKSRPRKQSEGERSYTFRLTLAGDEKALAEELDTWMTGYDANGYRNTAKTYIVPRLLELMGKSSASSGQPVNVDTAAFEDVIDEFYELHDKLTRVADKLSKINVSGQQQGGAKKQGILNANYLSNLTKALKGEEDED